MAASEPAGRGGRLLAGNIPLHPEQTKRWQRHAPPRSFADPKLRDVLDQIELRAHVELAKLDVL